VGSGIVHVSKTGGGDMHDREVVVDAYIGRPWKCPPHSSFSFHVAPIPDAHIGHDVNVVPLALGSSCNALARPSVRVVPSPSLYSPFSECPCAMGFAAWGNGDGRTQGGAVRVMGGASPIARARVSRLRRLHTIFDGAASCIGGIAKRSRGGEHDGLHRAAPSVVRLRRDGQKCGRAGLGRVGRCASSCGVHEAGFGLECTAATPKAMCVHAAERGGWRYWSRRQ
jgi:hypothetical protein